MARKKSKILKKQKLEEIFKIIAPGTPLREAVNRIQEASLGALIVLADSKELSDVMGGGFQLNTSYSPQKVYELAKMDGAIIISPDIKTIHAANIQLQPDFKLKTDESGTRHQTAHRISQQKGNVVVAVSERRNKITIYKNDFRYILHNIGDLLAKSSQAITSLEKYALAIENGLSELNINEADKMVSLIEVIELVRMYGLLFRMAEELTEYILELGTDGRLVTIQYEEMMLNQEEIFESLVKDYKTDKVNTNDVFNKLLSLTKEELLEDENIAKILGYDLNNIDLEEIISTKGYRMLKNMSKLTNKDIELLVTEFKSNHGLFLATSQNISEIKGISKFKANYIYESIQRIKNKIINER